MSDIHPPEDVTIQAREVQLAGTLLVPSDAIGLVVFAHGSGSSRLSSRNRRVAEALHERRLGTLLFDLLTEDEERADAINAQLRFDIEMLADRLVQAIDWLRDSGSAHGLPIGLFGASTGAAAALIAAAERPEVVRAVVSRGGRPDLARSALERVDAPTLLIVGGHDTQVLELNRQAALALGAHARLTVVPGATHLFVEPGTLDQVANFAWEWFARHLPRWSHEPSALQTADWDLADAPSHTDPFVNRVTAGRELAELLAARLDHEDLEDAVLFAIPRGGVPVAAQVAKELGVPLDVVLVRKIGAPLQPEYAIGALVEHEAAYINEQAAMVDGASSEYLEYQIELQSREIERQRRVYAQGRELISPRGRHAIVIDDGLATGTTALAAGRFLREQGARTTTLAVPVAARQSIDQLQTEYDRCYCVRCPRLLTAVGLWYRDFLPPTDEEIVALLQAHSRVRHRSLHR